jgi:hypothetical protein
MKQRCPRCESWSAEDATRCPCGHQFDSRPGARLHRPPPPREDDGRVRELQLASRNDIRNGIILIAVLAGLNIALYAMGGTLQPRLVPSLGLFWGVILIVRGLRVRREAWELEHLGFIERERTPKS